MKKGMVWAIIMCMLFTAGAEIPEINFSVKPVPENEALAFTRAMGAGWNLGNTFDVFDYPWVKDDLMYETAWQGDMTTEALIEEIKAAGFSSIRIPVSWHNHMDENFVINPAWLARVKQVVTWAYERDMYVIINIHHDCYKKYYYPSSECLENSVSFVSAVWSQVAAEFKEYGERLIFENLNEPRLKDTVYEWNFDTSSAEVNDAVYCINVLNQTMVDTVRAAGGCNETRYIMVSGYDASPEGALASGFTLPADSADNRIIVSTHAYIPYTFALLKPGEAGSEDSWDLNSPGSTSVIAQTLEKLYQRYVKNGIPVVMGEFGSLAKPGNAEARINHAAYYTASAAIRNIPVLWWDNNSYTGSGENFGLIHRGTLVWEYPEIVRAILTYAMTGSN